jgi:phosphoglycerol transferase MdoB-like AlkP superfamily enzyme
MENIFLIAVFATVVFCLAKFVEMKFVEKEMKPLKLLVRDAVMVFVSTALSVFVYSNMNGSISEFFNTLTETKTAPVGGAAEIFTDSPGF